MSRGSGTAPLTVPEQRRVGEFGLGPDFWAEFRQRYWGRRPVVPRRALTRPLLTADEAFEGLVSAGERYRAHRRAAPINFYIEHAVIQADVGLHLPAATDGSLTAYAERVSRRVDGGRFGVVAEDIQRHDARLWLRLREFVRHLYPVTGWPGEKAKSWATTGTRRSASIATRPPCSSSSCMDASASWPGRRRSSTARRTWPTAPATSAIAARRSSSRVSPATSSAELVGVEGSNSGAPCRVRDLVARHARASGATPAVAAGHVRTLLEKLWSLWAIVVKS